MTREKDRRRWSLRRLAATAAVLGLDSVDTLVAQLGKSKTALKEDKLYDAVITKITAEAQFVVTGS